MIKTSQWFTEACLDRGSAFSLEIKGKLHDEKTPYQHIEIYDTVHYGKLMVIDGCVMLTTRDNFLYHEMMSHPILFTHPNPKHVIIIGGGDCGTLQQVLKHPTIEDVIQIEIDERVTRLSEKYFPELCANNDDERAVLHFGDGIKWMAEAPPEFFDIVIIDSTDPVGPAEGLFTKSFYDDCVRVLRPDGMLVQQGESPFYHLSLIKDMHDAMKSAGFSSTEILHFPQPCYPTGWWSASLASKSLSLHKIRTKQAKSFSDEHKFRYYGPKIHEMALTSPKFVKEALSS